MRYMQSTLDQKGQTQVDDINRQISMLLGMPSDLLDFSFLAHRCCFFLHGLIFSKVVVTVIPSKCQATISWFCCVQQLMHMLGTLQVVFLCLRLLKNPTSAADDLTCKAADLYKSKQALKQQRCAHGRHNWMHFCLVTSQACAALVCNRKLAVHQDHVLVRHLFLHMPCKDSIVQQREQQNSC